MEVCTEKMTYHQFFEKGTRNVYLNHNEMKALCECYPNQEKNQYLIDNVIEQ